MPKKKQPQQPQQQQSQQSQQQFRARPKGKTQHQYQTQQKPSGKPNAKANMSSPNKRMQPQQKRSQQQQQPQAEIPPKEEAAPAPAPAADTGMTSFFGLLEQAAVGVCSPQAQAPVAQKGALETNFLWCITRLIGLRVEVHTRDGTIFDGVLYSVHQSEKMGLDILLQYATVRPQESTPNAIMPEGVQVLRIPHTEFVQIVAKNVSKPTASGGMPGGAGFGAPGALSSNYGVLQTDREIGALNKKGSNEQELVPWNFGDSSSLTAGSESLDDMTLDDYKSEGWDQIAVNREKFGVKCTYDEEIYTTHLDKEAPEYEERNARAAVIAREIESESSTNIHVLEDRGKNVAGEYSEEMMYSAATKMARRPAYTQSPTQLQPQQKLPSPSMSSGAYVPPHLRSAAAAAGNNTVNTMSPKSSPQAFITPASPKSSKPIVEVNKNINFHKFYIIPSLSISILYIFIIIIIFSINLD